MNIHFLCIKKRNKSIKNNFFNREELKKLLVNFFHLFVPDFVQKSVDFLQLTCLNLAEK